MKVRILPMHGCCNVGLSCMEAWDVLETSVASFSSKEVTIYKITNGFIITYVPVEYLEIVDTTA